jgi:hypothetical protein
MITSTCLCEKIQFHAEPIPGMVFNCHCTRCQRSHGAAFATQAFVDPATVKFIKGENLLNEYQSTGGIRSFCSECGSRLLNYSRDKTSYTSVAVACVQEKDALKPNADCFTANKIEWCSLDGQLKDYEGLPDL